MPATLAKPQTETLRELVRLVKGIQASDEPELITDETMLADSVNFAIEGAIPGATAGGFLISRPGLRGALSAVQAGPVVACKRFVQPVAQTHCLLLAICNGPSSALCRVFLWTYGGTTVTEVKDASAAHVDFNAYPDGIDLGVPSIKFEEVGSYIFMIGAADTLSRRMPLDSISAPVLELATGLLTPTAAPTVSVTNYPLGTTPMVASQWKTDQLSGASNNVLNGDFSSGTGNLGNWTKGGAMAVDVVSGSLGGFPGNFVRLDDKPSWITSDRVLNVSVANTNDTYGTRYASKIAFSANYWTDPGGINDGVTVTINLYSVTSGGSPIATLVYEFDPGIVSALVPLAHVFSFEGVDTTTILSYDVTLGAGSANRPGSNGPYLSEISAESWVQPTAFGAAFGGGVLVSTEFFGTVLTPASQNNLQFWGDAYWAAQINGSAGSDLQNVNTFDMPVTLGYPFADNAIRFRFGFKCGADLSTAQAAQPILSDPGQVLTTASGQAYFEADLTTISAANRAAMAACYIVEIIWTSDAPAASGTTNNGLPLTILSFVNAGNMAAGLPYFVVVQEETGGADITTATTIESGFSPISLPATTDHLNAALSIVPGALTNDGTPPDPLADSYKIGIGGGTDITPAGQAITFYAVYVVPISTGGGAWPGFSYSGGVYTSDDGYATWNPTTRTLITDIPDSVRRQDPIMTDHNQPPVNACAIAIYSNRLVYAAGNTIYISRLTTGISQGIYFNDAPDPFAPDYAVAGNSDPVGVLEGVTVGGSIINLVPFGPELIIFFASYIYILSGSNNANFNVRQYKRRPGIGLVARNAVGLTEAGISFLGLAGLYTYNGQDVSQAFAFDIASILNPAAEYTGPALNVTAFARSSIVYHDGRIYLSVPTASSGAVIAQTLVWDSRTHHWVGRWLLGPILCGETFTGSGETGALVLGDGLGMISTLGLNQYGDKATSSSSAAPVAVSFVGRRRIDPTNADNDIAAVRYMLTCQCADTDYTVNFNIIGYGGSTESSWGSQSYSLHAADGETGTREPVFVSQASGRTLQQTFGATTTNALIVRRAGYEFVQTRVT